MGEPRTYRMTFIEHRPPTETYPHRDLMALKLTMLHIQRLRRSNGELAYRAMIGTAVVGEWHTTIEGACRSLGGAIGRLIPGEVTEAFGSAEHLTPCAWTGHDPKRVFGRPA